MSGPLILDKTAIRLPSDLRLKLVMEDPEALALALLEALGDIGEFAEPQNDNFALRAALFRACELAIAHRKADVRVLGTAEAFVRSFGEDGMLEQVIRGVSLSLHDGTLYQRTKRVHNGNEWVEEVEPSPHRAFLKAAAYDRLNGTAGCTVVMPKRVAYDGEEVPNPHRVRLRRGDGRLGEVELVVMAVRVIGMSPMTGAPAVLDYTLEYQPMVELRAALQELSESAIHAESAAVQMVSEDDLRRQPGWRYIPLAGGVGYVCQLSHAAVRRCFTRYARTNADAIRWASTYARRNALRAHPAFAGVSNVAIDRNGHALVPMVGWTGDAAAMTAWQRLVQALVAGEAPPADVEHVELQEQVELTDVEPETAAPITTPEEQEMLRKNALIEQIDALMIRLPASRLRAAIPPGYPADLSEDDLAALLSSLQED
jgi:hypothetical protein